MIIDHDADRRVHGVLGEHHGRHRAYQAWCTKVNIIVLTMMIVFILKIRKIEMIDAGEEEDDGSH